MPSIADVQTYPEDAAAEALVGTMNSLVEATADAALLERLQGASNRVLLLTAEQDALVARLAAIAQDKAKAADNARFARFTSISVRDLTPDEHVIRSHFEITYMALTWDSRMHQSVPAPQTVLGFGGLSDDAFHYLLERHPDQIPAKITALASNAYDAFQRYFMGMRRGNLIGNDYDVQQGKGA